MHQFLRAALRGSPSPRAARWLSAALAGVFLALLFAHVAGRDIMLGAVDAPHLYVPVKERTAAALAAGSLPLWHDGVGRGVPFLANPMNQALYPGNVIFLLLDPVRGLKLFVLVHFVLTVLAFRRLAFAYGVRGFAALLGAFVFAGCGAVVSMHWNPLWMAGLPWTLFAMALTRRVLRFDGVKSPPRVEAGRYLTLGLCCGLTGLACAFELLVAFAWFAAVECVAAWWAWPRREAGFATFSMRLGGLALAAVLAFGVAAVQLVPTWEFLALGSRAGGVGVEEAGLWSLPPLRLFELLVPELFTSPSSGRTWHTLLLDDMRYHSPFLPGIYLGAPAAVLAALGFTVAPRRDRVVLAGVIAVTVLLAFGSTTPLFPLVREVMPGVSYFRYPVKILVCSMIPVALLAALGAQRLLDGVRRVCRAERWVVWSPVVLLALGLAVVTIWNGALESWLERRLADADLDPHAPELAGGVRGAFAHGLATSLLFAALLSIRGRLSRGVLAAALVLALVVEPAAVNRALVVTTSAAHLAERPDGLPDPAALVEPAGTMRLGSVLPGEFQFLLPPYLASYLGYRAALDYGAMQLTTTKRFDEELAGRRDRALALSSIRYVLRKANGPSAAPVVERVEDSLPRASFVPRAMIAPDDEAAAWYLRSEAFDPRVEVVLHDAPEMLGGVGRGSSGAASSARVLMLTDAASVVRVRVEASGEGFLVLTDSWYPGWTASVDGRVVPIHRANLAFRAIHIPAGDHEVAFTYAPASVAIGGFVTLASLASALVWAGVALARRRRSRGGGAPLETVEEAASEGSPRRPDPVPA